MSLSLCINCFRCYIDKKQIRTRARALHEYGVSLAGTGYERTWVWSWKILRAFRKFWTWFWTLGKILKVFWSFLKFLKVFWNFWKILPETLRYSWEALEMLGSSYYFCLEIYSVSENPWNSSKIFKKFRNPNFRL